MKALLISGFILIFFVFGAACHSESLPPESQNTLKKENLIIEPETLPQPIKAAISANSLISEFPVVGASQIPKIDSSLVYEAIFDDKSEEIINKKYSSTGKENKE